MSDRHPDQLGRLTVEFAGQISAAEIAHVLEQCEHDLDTSQLKARPELLERLARQRLNDSI